MITRSFEKPINRLGFVMFCMSLCLCLIAYFVTYGVNYKGMDWLGHLIFGNSYYWQQSAFKLGLAGAAIGAALAWDFLAVVTRLINWITKS